MLPNRGRSLLRSTDQYDFSSPQITQSSKILRDQDIGDSYGGQGALSASKAMPIRGRNGSRYMGSSS